MLKSIQSASQNRKLVIRYEAIALLTPPQLRHIAAEAGASLGSGCGTASYLASCIKNAI